MFTLIVMLVVMGHLSKSLRVEIGYGIGAEQSLADSLLMDQLITRYGGVGTSVFDPSTTNANLALRSILKVSLIVFFFFFAVPFSVYLTFISSLNGALRSYETSWVRIIQIYSYSMACFIPGSALMVILAPFSRAKWVLTFALAGLACYYQYKEQIETCKRILTYNLYRKMYIGLIFTNLLFAFCVKQFTSSVSK
jgi:hypothetical protein